MALSAAVSSEECKVRLLYTFWMVRSVSVAFWAFLRAAASASSWARSSAERASRSLVFLAVSFTLICSACTYQEDCQSTDKRDKKRKIHTLRCQTPQDNSCARLSAI